MVYKAKVSVRTGVVSSDRFLSAVISSITTTTTKHQYQNVPLCYNSATFNVGIHDCLWEPKTRPPLLVLFTTRPRGKKFLTGTRHEPITYYVHAV